MQHSQAKLESEQGDHSPGKPRKPGQVREFQSGQGKVREMEKVREKSAEVKSKYSKTCYTYDAP